MYTGEKMTLMKVCRASSMLTHYSGKFTYILKFYLLLIKLYERKIYFIQFIIICGQ